MRSRTELRIPAGDIPATTALLYTAGAPRLDATLILAHGAGAGQHSPFMVSTAEALAARGLDIVTFNFPYTEQRRRIPDRTPVLEECYRRVIEEVRAASGSERLFIGGKSMGGRIATHVAAAGCAVRGIVLLGYPLHPPGKPNQRRDAHLPSIRCPMLFVQGSRDAFGTPEELAPALAAIRPAATVHVVAGGDHSFKVPRAAAADQKAVLDGVYRHVAEWIERTS